MEVVTIIVIIIVIIVTILIIKSTSLPIQLITSPRHNLTNRNPLHHLPLKQRTLRRFRSHRFPRIIPIRIHPRHQIEPPRYNTYIHALRVFQITTTLHGIEGAPLCWYMYVVSDVAGEVGFSFWDAEGLVLAVAVGGEEGCAAEVRGCEEGEGVEELGEHDCTSIVVFWFAIIDKFCARLL